MTENQFDAYRTAKSTRPMWANALIVAGVIALAGVVFAVLGMSTTVWVFAAAAVAAVIAGIAALVGVTRRVP